jgi:hypothetical protein
MGPRSRAGTVGAVAAALILLLAGCGASGRQGAASTAAPTSTSAPAKAAQAGGGAAGPCTPAPIHHGAPPGWTAPAWSSSSGPLRIPYALASGEVAAAFFFARLRAGHPDNPANKVLWVVQAPREGQPLVIQASTARSPGRTVVIRQEAGSGPGNIYPSSVDLPTPGCWRLALRWGVHRATIDVTVRPAGAAA